MFNFFKKKKKPKNNDLINKRGKLIRESSLVSDRNNIRFLKLNDDTCGLILYPDNNVEVIFTKANSNGDQSITNNEEVLMALALFMKQPGFLEMIVSEFRNIAMNKITTLTEEEDK